MNGRDWQNRTERPSLSNDEIGGAEGDQRIDHIRRIAMQRRIQRKRDEAAEAEQGQGQGAAAKQPVAGPPAPPRPLPADVRQKMERQLGADFGAVRVHVDDPKATELGAKAYTEGADIHFAPGHFNPDSADGLSLLGHELAHVVQQGAAPVKPPPPAAEKTDAKPAGDDPQAKDGAHGAAAGAPPVQKKGVGANDDGALEKEADTMGARAAAAPDAAGGKAVTKGDEDKKFSLGDKLASAVGIGKQISVGKEKVRVYSEAEEAEAPKIIADIKDKYGIEISSTATVEAIKAQYGNVPEDVKKSLTTMEWEFKELKALKAALDHYAPVLGKAREQSSKKDEAQEVTSIGKVKQAIDSNSKDGALDNSTLGEYFGGSKNFGMFKAGTNSHVDFKDSAKQLEATAVHEMAHGFFADQYDNFVAKGSDGYWIDQNTASGDKKAEAPPTDYGKKNAREDLAESVMLYFVAEGTLSSKCPKRHAFIKQVVDAWQAKQGGDKDKDKDGGADGAKPAAPKKGGCA